jgi:hypothetical protein
MNGLKKEISAITMGQWAVLITLSFAVNIVVLIGIAIIYAPTDLRTTLAQAPILLTRTAFPTFTLTPTGTPLATPQNTSVPTWTPTISPTPASTNTPTATAVPTRMFVQAVAIALPTDIPTPTPAYDYVGTIRQFTPCENQGKHHIFAYIRDPAGNGIPGVRMRVFWPNGEAFLVTGTKIEDAGLADFAMFKGSYFIEVVDGVSEVIGPISPDIPLNETCQENGNTEANSFYHYSFEVIFTKMR